MSNAFVTNLPVAPFGLHSVHFDFPGGQAIQLRDPTGINTVVGATPEWVASPARNETVAYVRGTRPHVRAVFRGDPSANGEYVVGADGTPSQVGEERTSLVFDPITKLSAPVLLRMSFALPDRIGVHQANFDWYVRDRNDSSACIPIGVTLHKICTSWRPMSVNIGQRLHGWAYDRLMAWTCKWAAGCNDEKEICDAILRNLPDSGLKYGIVQRDVRRMLLDGGGMCGGWYRMFQQMAQCQGVFIHCRCFFVDWRRFPNGEEHWCAIVIRSAGLNQQNPTHSASEFHDNDTVFPVVAPTPLAMRVERRYRFYGLPGLLADGHCINFLEYGGRIYLYDCCFRSEPVEIDSPLPPDNLSKLGGAQLRSFKLRYLDKAVDYMLGSVYNGVGGEFLRTTSMLAGGQNGMTVRTARIPEIVNGNPGITFCWAG